MKDIITYNIDFEKLVLEHNEEFQEALSNHIKNLIESNNLRRAQVSNFILEAVKNNRFENLSINQEVAIEALFVGTEVVANNLPIEGETNV